MGSNPTSSASKEGKEVSGATQLIEEALLKVQEAKAENAKSEKDVTKIRILVGEALDNANRATKLNPENPEIWFQRGNIYFETEELGIAGAKEWAIKCYEKALELDPNNSLYQEKLEEVKAPEKVEEEIVEPEKGVTTLPPGVEKIGETEKFVIYQKSEWDGQVKNYRIFKLDFQTGEEIELRVLNYSFERNAEFYLSPDGKYVARTLWYGRPGKIELLSLDNIEKLTTLVEEGEEVLIKMIWADDSSKIAYWTVNRGAGEYPPPFKIHLIDLEKTLPTVSLIKVYNDMSQQGTIQFENLVSSERKLYLKRAKITNGAPPLWEEEVISF